MRHKQWICLLAVWLLVSTWGCLQKQDSPKARAVQLNYQLVLKEVPSEMDETDIWVPVPMQTPFQVVSDFKIKNSPPGRLLSEPEYGNQFIHFRLKDNLNKTLTLGFTCTIVRKEQIASGNIGTDEVLARWLQPDRLVTISERVRHLSKEITGQKSTPIEKTRAIYNYVLKKMKYDKSQPYCTMGDTEFALDSGLGNCTNFHSLFISLARASGIPAKFIIGYPLPEDKEGQLNGYHCWVEFYLPDIGWVPADISQASKHPEKRDYFFGKIDANRIQFTQGRDILLVPTQKSERLNYFVYPYIEINGHIWDKYDLKIDYKELNEGNS